MENEQIQPPMDTSADLTDDEIAAVLGFSTNLSEQMMPKPEEGGEPVESTQGEPTEAPTEAPQEDLSGQLDEIEQKLEKLLEKEGIENDKETENTEPAEEDTADKE